MGGLCRSNTHQFFTNAEILSAESSLADYNSKDLVFGVASGPNARRTVKLKVSS